MRRVSCPTSPASLLIWRWGDTVTLYAGTIPPEILKLAMDIRRDLVTVLNHLEDRNYGLAHDWVIEACNKLPEDTGPHIVWPELEHRTT